MQKWENTVDCSFNVIPVAFGWILLLIEYMKDLKKKIQHVFLLDLDHELFLDPDLLKSQSVDLDPEYCKSFRILNTVNHYT